MYLHKALVLVLLGLLVSSCRNIERLEMTGVKGLKVDKISMNGIEGELMLGIKNPNRFGFSIYPSAFDIRYSGVALGKANLTERVKIKGNSENTYSFKLKSDFREANLVDVMKLLSGATFKNELEVKGELRAGKLFVRRSLPVDLKEKISLR